MRAKIHTGKAGKHYTRLCKEYETSDFYEVMVNSVANGQMDQAVEYFNMLGGPWQYAFMNGGYLDYGYYGAETYNLILSEKGHRMSDCYYMSGNLTVNIEAK